MKTILVTCALPYANGPLHLGHLLEHIQADIWVRYQRIFNNNVYFVCGDDTHGTPIMLKAKEQKISPDLFINKIFINHLEIVNKFNISFDLYGSSNDLLNYKYVKNIFINLYNNNYIFLKKIKQLYDNKLNLFLPDRYIIGTCPKCLSTNQTGEVCDNCSNLFNNFNIINPISFLSKTTPIYKYTNHYFVKLTKQADKIFKWLKNNNIIIKPILNKLLEWSNNIQDWNISRDNPYFGFLIPNINNKYFCVWFDALITYIYLFKKLFINNKKNLNKVWNNQQTLLYQFIGKDIIYYHCLFWPILLNILNLKKPNYIFVHGYVTLKGKKLSKSKNQQIIAKQWLKYYDVDSLRYFFASKINNDINDIEFDLPELVNKINKELINKIINLISRSSKFINLYFNNYLAKKIINYEILNTFIQQKTIIQQLAIECKFNKILIIIIKLADTANYYFDNQHPWTYLNNFNNKNKILIHNIITITINMFKILMIFIKPIIPNIAEKVEKILNIKLTWNLIETLLLNHKINHYHNLYNYITVNNNIFN